MHEIVFCVENRKAGTGFLKAIGRYAEGTIQSVVDSEETTAWQLWSVSATPRDLTLLREGLLSAPRRPLLDAQTLWAFPTRLGLLARWETRSETLPTLEGLFGALAAEGAPFRFRIEAGILYFRAFGEDRHMLEEVYRDLVDALSPAFRFRLLGPRDAPRPAPHWRAAGGQKGSIASEPRRRLETKPPQV